MIHCRHTWIQDAQDEPSAVNGTTVIKYTHHCPQCGKIKTTVRALRSLPPEAKWKRELEKLLERARQAGWVYALNSPGTPPFHIQDVILIPNNQSPFGDRKL